MNWRLMLLLVAALGLRLAIAPLPSFWVDEAFTIRLLDDDLGGVVSGVADTESTPPLYYALAWLWTQAAGVGELGLRSLSAVAGAATVGFAWALGRWLAGPRAALAAGALTAVNPFLLWFSTEARAYALATALTTAALVLLVRLIPNGDGARGRDEEEATRHDRRRLAAWSALGAGALLTHYATVFVLLGQAVILLHRRSSRATWLAVGAVATVGAALLPLAIAQRGNEHAQSLDAIGGPIGERVAQLPKQFAIGYDAPAEIVAAGLALIVLALGIALALLGDGARRDPAAGLLGRRRPDDATPRLRERSLILLTVVAGGLLAPLAIAVTGLDVVSSRYLLPALPPLLAIAGAGLVARAWRRLGPALAVLLAGGWLAIAVAVAADPRLQTRADWQGVEDALGPAPAAGRAIVTSPSNGALVLVDGYRIAARYGPPRPVREIVLAATGDEGSAPPGLPEATPGFAAAGFRLVEQRRERGYVLQRWRADSPQPIDPTLLDQAALDRSPPAVVWQP